MFSPPEASHWQNLLRYLAGASDNACASRPPAGCGKRYLLEDGVASLLSGIAHGKR